jgi:hypothetical protein
MRIFGHEFKEMTSVDWMAFAGAEPGTLICYIEEHAEVLFWEPENKMLSICTYDEHGSGNFDQYDYQIASINKIT